VQVVGFAELIKISKRVHVSVSDVTEEVGHRRLPTHALEVPLDVVQSAREGGIHFEAHIPLSRQALER
jgi:hypothetical protein